MIKWSPEERIEALDALKHPFILNGLPKQVKMEHLKQVNSENPYGLYWSKKSRISGFTIDFLSLLCVLNFDMSKVGRNRPVLYVIVKYILNA